MKQQTLLLLTLLSQLTFAQVVINEASTKNTSSLVDKDVEYSDWIELYNTGGNTADLSTLYLSDDKGSLDKWLIGDAKLASNDHLLIFSSGKNIPFTSTVEKAFDAATSNYYEYADISDQSGLGGSTIEALDFPSILGNKNGKNVFSAKANIVDNSGPGDLGYSYAGLFIQQGNWGTINDFSEYNSLKIKANISNGKTLQLRIVQDGVNSWEGFTYDLKGSGTEEEYLIPIFKNAKGIDLTQITGVQFEVNPPAGITEFTIEEIQFESRSKVPALSNNYISYSDISNGGSSTVVENKFPQIGSVQNGYNALSATINYADNTPDLTFSYAAIQSSLFSDNDSLDLSEYDNLLVNANIENGKTIKVALYQHGTEDWLSYGKVLTGTGNDTTYIIPLTGNVSPLDLTKIKSIGVEGLQPFGERSFTIYKMEFEKNIGLNEGHTNFKLEGSGETVYLTNGLNILDSMEVPKLSENLSYGRIGDGGTTYGIFEQITPDSANPNIAFNGLCQDTITFNLTSGFYPSHTNIELNGSNIIRYTTNGSLPTSTSSLYTSPLLLDSTTVIKAACFTNNTLSDLISISTFIINEDTHLPVFSISSDPDNFFSDEKGILADGPGWTEEQPHFGANFWEDWVIPAHMEFFDENGDLKLAQNIGVKVFGGWSRAGEQKSLRLIADKDYGDNDFDYHFFKHKNIESFKHIVLRNSGNDFNVELFHDAINHVALRDLKTEIDYLEYQPSVVFLNGEYWGIMNIREKINEHYLKNNHGLDKDEVEIYDAWGQGVHNPSTNNGIESIETFATNNDLSIQSNFDQVNNLIDLNNMIDFFATNTYISNWDWPQNNLKFWRPVINGVQGKFRYIFFDTDITLGKFGLQTAEFDQIDRIINDENIGPNARIFSALTKNNTFKNAFINRSADFMNTIHNEDNYINIIDKLAANIAQEVPKNDNRWTRWTPWLEAIQETKDFLAPRDSAAWLQIKDQFALPNIHSITIDVDETDGGQIKLNSLTPTLPWSGDYFETVPITLTATAYPGYTFNYWETSTGNITNDTLTIDLLKNESVIAHFIGSQYEVNLAITEINYNSSPDYDYKDFIELHNYGNTIIDLSKYVLKDDKDYHQYTIPEGTILSAGGYLVLAEFPAFITTKHPSRASSIIGGYDFGFGSGGDNIRLYNQFGDEVINMTYDDKSPWPTEADGSGYTLENELISTVSLSDPNTWIAGCFGGSPGIEFDPTCFVGLSDKLTNNTIYYPNPTKNIIHLTIDADNYIIYSTTGLVIDKGNARKTIDLSLLPTGSYIIKLSSKEKIQREAIIKL